MKKGFSLIEIMVYSLLSMILIICLFQSIYNHYTHFKNLASRMNAHFDVESALHCLTHDLIAAWEIKEGRKERVAVSYDLITSHNSTIEWYIKNNRLLRKEKGRGCVVAGGIKNIAIQISKKTYLVTITASDSTGKEIQRNAHIMRLI